MPQRMAVRDDQNDVRGEATTEEVQSNIEIFLGTCPRWGIR
jgi:hypothetical protein